MMVALPKNFDARTINPILPGALEKEPAVYALHLWLQYENADADMDVHTALSLAAYDLEVYDAFQKWAWQQDVDTLSLEWQAAIGRVLGRRPPRKGKGSTARRNVRFNAIADVLAREYKMPRAQADHGGSIVCAAAILATLPGAPSEGTIANIISASRK